jgi:hypothetical protein
MLPGNYNSSESKTALFLMDYANQRRVKVWGTARVVERDAALMERLRDPAYPGKVERPILFSVSECDVNCQQHIQERYSRRQIAAAVGGLHKRIAELEAEVERLRPSTQPARESSTGVSDEIRQE